jgi:hypothetical protein
VAAALLLELALLPLELLLLLLPQRLALALALVLPELLALPLELLIRLLHARWALDIHPHAPADAAATCLLAVARRGAGTLIAQLGDGMVMLARADGSREELAGDRSGFSNQTTALGAARSAQEWSVHEAAPMAPGDILVVATDGVSDDLITEKKHAFALHLLQTCRVDGALDDDRLYAQLDDWPVPNHTDDRTLVLCSLRGDDA